MLPEEAQALMAKVLLIVFGTLMLCFSKVRASELQSTQISQHPIAQSIDYKL